MTKPKNTKREKISVASETRIMEMESVVKKRLALIDRIEEQRLRCQGSLERAEFRHRREQLSEEDRQALEDEMAIMNERIQKYEKELAVLRRENRRNTMLSVALLAITALFYYAFIN